MALQPTCTFCQILTGAIGASLVYKDEFVTAFMDIQPLVRGHLLVIPNDHCPSLEHLDDAMASRMFTVALHLAQAIRRSDLPVEGVNFYLADGAAAGQKVFHTHLHVIPRLVGDGFKIHFPPGYGHRPSRRELDDIAEVLKKAMNHPME